MGGSYDLELCPFIYVLFRGCSQMKATAVSLYKVTLTRANLTMWTPVPPLSYQRDTHQRSKNAKKGSFFSCQVRDFKKKGVFFKQ